MQTDSMSIEDGDEHTDGEEDLLPEGSTATTRPSAVTANDQPKVFRSTGYPIVSCGAPPASRAWLYQTLTEA
ncbi:hypothetical protein [Streptomyces flavochromogenes]|uniref:hypothetical protein n=1 Tax=Streptomyces flavochromogenes TaxID=68199 RepID=UPI003CC90EE2